MWHRSADATVVSGVRVKMISRQSEEAS